MSSEKKNINLIYAESPLQLMSSIAALDDSVYYIYLRGRSVNDLFNLLAKKDLRKISFLKLLVIVFSKKITNLIIGDLRSSLAIVLMARSSNIMLVDDGNYTIQYDNGGLLFLNSNFKWIKKLFIKSFISLDDVHRRTILRTKIIRKYKSIVEKKLTFVLKEFHLEKMELPYLYDGDIIYVESSYKSLMTESDERSIYTKIQEYAGIRNSKLKIILHRKSCAEDVIKLLTNENNVEVFRCKFPIEFLFYKYRGKNIKFIFAYTSALVAARDILSNNQITIVKLNAINFYNSEFENEVGRYYREIPDDSFEKMEI